MSFVEKNSRYTVLFEAVVLDWLRNASISAVAESFGLSWDGIDGIMQPAIDRGLARREGVEVKSLGIDETSFRKRHDYVTAVRDEQGSEAVKEWTQGQGWCFPVHRESISMDMRDPYISRGDVSELCGGDRV